MASVELKGFEYYGTLTEEQARVVGQLVRLETVQVGPSKIGKAEAAQIVTLPQLKTLVLGDCEITNAGFVELARSKTIVDLFLVRTPTSDAEVEPLAAMKQLTNLSIQGTRITEAGFKRLKAALPKCNVGWEDPTQAILTRLLARGSTFQLRLSDNKIVNVMNREEIPPGPFTLVRFDTVWNTDFNDQDMLWLEPFTTIEFVGLQGHTVTAAGLRSLLPSQASLTQLAYHGTLGEEDLKVLSQLPRLSSISNHTGKIAEANAKRLADLPQLQWLHLPHCDVTAGAVAQLARSKTISDLTFLDCTVSDVEIGHLGTMKQLKKLAFVNTRVTDAGLKTLTAALPDCGINWNKKPCPRIIPSDDWVSLMPILDPKKDHAGGVGTWVRTDAVLEGSHDNAGNMVRLRAPLTVKGDYELEVEFTRPKDAPNSVVFEIAVGPNNGVAVILGNGGKAGLGLIKGQDFDMNDTAKDFLLGNDKRIRALLRVKATGTTATVETDIDGKPLLAWKGKPETLSVGSGGFVPGTIDLCFGPPGKIVIRSVRFRLLEGSASLTRPEDAAKLFEAKKP